jgi:hypothetical protein
VKFSEKGEKKGEKNGKKAGNAWRTLVHVDDVRLVELVEGRGRTLLVVQVEAGSEPNPVRRRLVLHLPEIRRRLLPIVLSIPINEISITTTKIRRKR